MQKHIVQVNRMKTDADRVRFAVRFASEPLPQSARGLDKLRRELAAFLGMTRRGGDKEPGGFGVEVNAVRPPHPWDYTLAQLFMLQEDARQMIEAAVDGRGGHSTVISDDQEIIADVVGLPTTRTLRIGGSVRAGFLLTLAFLLAGTGAPPVLKCPECGRLFVRVRRQKYCRDECTDRATWRNYPKEKKQRARQRQYDKYNWTLGARSKEKGKTR